jgi:transcriptional regulator with XRE-family HTH domain
MDRNEIIGGNIKKMRGLRGLNKSELARRLIKRHNSQSNIVNPKRWTAQSIVEWERGEHFPTVPNFALLAQELGITPNDLYGITANTIARTDLMNAKIDLLEVLEHNEWLTFDNIPLPLEIRGNLVKAVSLVLDAVGLSKKNINVR